jgi:hypothetical protein
MSVKLSILGAICSVLELGSNKAASSRFVPTNAGPRGGAPYTALLHSL